MDGMIGGFVCKCFCKEKLDNHHGLELYDLTTEDLNKVAKMQKKLCCNCV